MLILTRRPDESLIIEPSDDIDQRMTLAELFARGPLVICVLEINGNQARIGIEAPKALNIIRDELLE